MTSYDMTYDFKDPDTGRNAVVLWRTCPCPPPEYKLVYKFQAIMNMAVVFVAFLHFLRACIRYSASADTDDGRRTGRTGRTGRGQTTTMRRTTGRISRMFPIVCRGIEPQRASLKKRCMDSYIIFLPFCFRKCRTTCLNMFIYADVYIESRRNIKNNNLWLKPPSKY